MINFQILHVLDFATDKSELEGLHPQPELVWRVAFRRYGKLVWGLGSRVRGLGFRVQGLGSRAQELGCSLANVALSTRLPDLGFSFQL